LSRKAKSGVGDVGRTAVFGVGKAITARAEYRKAVEAIEHGKPINPRHAQPATIDQSGYTYHIDDDDRAVFARTAGFGTLLNRRLSWGGWRVQETVNNEIPLLEECPLYSAISGIVPQLRRCASGWSGSDLPGPAGICFPPGR
jgi:hypothetical protein